MAGPDRRRSAAGRHVPAQRQRRREDPALRGAPPDQGHLGLRGRQPTEVEVRLTPGEAGGTILELEHSSPAEIIDELVRTYGPGGTIGIGGGWDLTLLALDLFLNGARFDPATWEDTPAAKEFATRSCQAWGPPIQAAWGTSDDDIAAAVAFGVQHFAPEAQADMKG